MRTPLTAALLALLLAPTAAVADTRPGLDQQHTAATVLAPGNSGFVSVTGQAQGMAGGPGDYGPHVDDQRELFWSGGYKPGDLTEPTGDVEEPRPGVRIGRDDAGVPVVSGDTAEDVWFGAGYAAGQDRLFLADAVRRYARGTYSALVGPSGLPIDRQARQVTYSEQEYAGMLATLPEESRRVITAYAEGLDAWIAEVRADPQKLPAEYALLTTLPEPWTVTDTLAAGVLITRTVASAGGDEFRSVERLRALEQALGREAGRDVFLDLNGTDDRRAPVTVPASEGAFESGPVPTRAVFDAAADRALALPPELGLGISAGVPAIPGGGTQDPDAVPLDGVAVPLQAEPAATPARQLVDFVRSLRGGSYQVVVAPSRTTTGGALLESAPQLGWSYPSVLWELEVHGGGYDARGVSVPGLPTVGIGYGERVAWALTTGNSKTIDSFVERVRRVDGALEHLHDGVWKPADCRVETIAYRQEVEGVPAGLPLQTEDLEVCRTVHGPVVAESDDGTLARSLQIAMWGRELETVNGILAWNRASTFAEFEAAVRQVTWNENVAYADADGRIAYWHPGLHPLRAPSVDPRLPSLGDGTQDWRGMRDFDDLPHVVDPAQGWIANWNGKPAVGWQDTWTADATSARPAGAASRVQALQDLLAADRSISPEELRAIDYRAGTLDHRARELLPVVLRLLGTTGLTDAQRAARDLLASWDGTAYGPGAGTSDGELTDDTVTDGPAPTVFRAVLQLLVSEVLRDVPRDVLLERDSYATHAFDATPADNLVLRVLDPSRSSLAAQHDYLAGRTRAAVVRTAVERAVAVLVDRYGADPESWRMRHPRSPVESLTGVIGPSLTMPFQDRGSWIHLVAFDRVRRGGAVAPRPVPTSAPLPATGSGPLLPVLAAGLLGTALVVRRTRRA